MSATPTQRVCPANVDGARCAADPMTRLLPVIAATLLLALVAASVAPAKTTFTIRGAGFGHGVGMSQYGAMGYAQQGRSAAEILAHYYTGTALGTTDPNRKVRVLLVAADDGGADHGRARRRARASSIRRVTYTLKRRGLSQVDLSASGQAARDVQRAAAGRGRRRGDHARRPGALPRRARVQAQRLQRPPGRQLGRTRGLPAGRRARGVARVVAGRGAQGAGHRRPHLRDHDGQERRLRPLRRHALAGLQGRRDRDRGDQQRRSPPRAGRSSPTRASRSSPTSSRPRAGAPSRSRTRTWATSRSRG